MSTKLTLSRPAGFAFFHVRGPGAVEDLGCWYGDLPSRWFHYKSQGESGFLARLGGREFYIFGPAGTLPDKTNYGASTYIFSRSDVVFSLEGDGYDAFLRELSAYDFAVSEPDEFILANMAGVSCWFRMPPAHSAQVLLGCDPSYGDYMTDTLTRTLGEFLSEDRLKEMT